MVTGLPAYLDHLVAAYHQGEAGRHIHLGYWDEVPPGPTRPTPVEFAQAQARLSEQIISRARLADEQSVLDVACGFGGTLAMLNAGLQRMQLHGVNIDPRQLEICATISPENGNSIDLVVADATTLPYKDESLDRVFCIEAMFHFSSRGAFLREAARVLRRDGLLATTDILFTPRSDIPGMDKLVEVMLNAYGPWPEPWLTESGLDQLALDAGLCCITADDISRQTLPSHRYTAPAYTGFPALSGEPARDAALVMQWLHQQGVLHYLIRVYGRPGAGLKNPR